MQKGKNMMKTAVKIFALLLAAALPLAACNRAPVPPIPEETDAETTGVPDVTAAPDTTGIPETAAPETKPAETTAKETSATVTAAYEEAWTVVTPAGCRTAGSEERIVNGVTEQREIPLLGHDIAKDGHCTRCGERFSYGLFYQLSDDAKPIDVNMLGYQGAFWYDADESYYIVTRGDCRDSDVIIPDYVNGRAIRTVHGFEKGTTGLVLPDTVRVIFSLGGSSLRSVTVPSGVTEIPEYCFEGCRELCELSLPDTLLTIRAYAFANCDSLKTIRLPDSVTEIDQAAFWLDRPTQAPGRTFVLSESLYDFSTVWNFTQNMLFSPYYGTKIMQKLYEAEDVVLDAVFSENGASYIGSKNNARYLLLALDPSIREFSVHPDTKIIWSHACENLEKVTLPEGLLAISESAFGEDLEEVTLPSSLKIIRENAFGRCKKISSFHVPAVEKLGVGAFPESSTVILADPAFSAYYTEEHLFYRDWQKYNK